MENIQRGRINKAVGSGIVGTAMAYQNFPQFIQNKSYTIKKQ